MICHHLNLTVAILCDQEKGSKKAPCKEACMPAYCDTMHIQPRSCCGFAGSDANMHIHDSICAYIHSVSCAALQGLPCLLPTHLCHAKTACCCKLCKALHTIPRHHSPPSCNVWSEADAIGTAPEIFDSCCSQTSAGWPTETHMDLVTTIPAGIAVGVCSVQSQRDWLTHCQLLTRPFQSAPTQEAALHSS